MPAAPARSTVPRRSPGAAANGGLAVDEVLLLEGVPGLCFSTDEGLTRAATANLERGEPVVLARNERITWIGVVPPDDDGHEAAPVRLN